MRYLTGESVIQSDKKAMQLYVDGKISADQAREIISINNNTDVTAEDFFRCTWAWGYLREPEARERLEEYKEEKRARHEKMYK